MKANTDEYYILQSSADHMPLSKQGLQFENSKNQKLFSTYSDNKLRFKSLIAYLRLKAGPKLNDLTVSTVL